MKKQCFFFLTVLCVDNVSLLHGDAIDSAPPVQQMDEASTPGYDGAAVGQGPRVQHGRARAATPTHPRGWRRGGRWAHGQDAQARARMRARGREARAGRGDRGTWKKGQRAHWQDRRAQNQGQKGAGLVDKEVIAAIVREELQRAGVKLQPQNVPSSGADQ